MGRVVSPCVAKGGNGAEAPEGAVKEPSDEQFTYRFQEDSNTLSLHIDTRYRLWGKGWLNPSGTMRP